MKKRIISALLAVCMVFALGTVGVLADNEATAGDTENTTNTTLIVKTGVSEGKVDAATGYKMYPSISTAISAAKSGDTILLQSNTSPYLSQGENNKGVYNINKNLIIDGGNNTISAITGDGSNTLDMNVHIFNITGGKVEIRNVIIDGNNLAKHAINVWTDQTESDIHVTLENVTAKNNNGYGVCIGGATVEATNLKTSGNDWGGVNVDTKNAGSTFELGGSETKLEDTFSVVLDSTEAKTNNVTLTAGEYKNVITNSVDPENQDHDRSAGTDNLTITGGTYEGVYALGKTGTGDKIIIEDEADVSVVGKIGSPSFVLNGAAVDKVVTPSGDNPEAWTAVESENLASCGIEFVNAKVGNTAVNTVVATVGDDTFTTLAAAITAAGNTDGTPVVLQADLNDLNELKVESGKTVTIKGNNHSITLITGSEDRNKNVIVSGTLTLDAVDLTVKSNVDSLNKGMGDAIDVYGTLNIINDSEITISKLQNAFVLQTEAAIVNVKNSTISADTIGGNFSNGGEWNIEGSTVTIDGCGSYALSVKTINTTNSNINISEVGIGAIYAIESAEIGANTKVTIDDCGSKLPWTTTSGYCYAPIQIRVGNSNSHNAAAGSIIKIDASATVTVTDNKGNNGDVYVVDGSKFDNRGTLSADVKVADSSKHTVTYVVDNKTVNVEMHAANEVIQLIEQYGSSAGFKWAVTDEEGKTTTYNPGAQFMVTGDVTFVEHYDVAPQPTLYSVTVNRATGGTATTTYVEAAQSVEVTVNLTASTGYKAYNVTVADATGRTVTCRRASDASWTFTMPAANVTVTPSFVVDEQPDDDDEYTVSPYTSIYGSAYCVTSNPEPGKTASIMVAPAEGYEVQSLRIYYSGGYRTLTSSTNLYTFTMPYSDVSIDVTFVRTNEFDIVIYDEHGDVEARVDGEPTVSADEYDVVYLYVEPDNGYVMSSLKVSTDPRFDSSYYAIDYTETSDGVYRFTMPDEDVYVEAEFVEGYEITVDSNITHGDITVDPEFAAAEDSTVRVYFDPDNGYRLGTLSVRTGDNNRTNVTATLSSDREYYYFTMPDDEVYITATFVTDSLPFTDVASSQWYYDGVHYVWTNGMMEGTSATTFNPNGTMSRAMFWAVLARIDGQTVTGTNWANTARSWAVANGVSDGTDPNGLVTREQMVTMLWRYIGEPGGSYNLGVFSDGSTVSSYAGTAMRWAISNGIIEGVGGSTLSPRGTATRAQCATIFMRYDTL